MECVCRNKEPSILNPYRIKEHKSLCANDLITALARPQENRPSGKWYDDNIMIVWDFVWDFISSWLSSWIISTMNIMI